MGYHRVTMCGLGLNFFAAIQIYPNPHTNSGGVFSVSESSTFFEFKTRGKRNPRSIVTPISFVPLGAVSLVKAPAPPSPRSTLARRDEPTPGAL